MLVVDQYATCDINGMLKPFRALALDTTSEITFLSSVSGRSTNYHKSQEKSPILSGDPSHLTPYPKSYTYP